MLVWYLLTSCFHKKNRDISIKIINKVVVEDQDVNFLIKNHSNQNYIILIDTLFSAYARYNNDYFLNPYFILSDSNNEEVMKVEEIIERTGFNKESGNLQFLKIKSRQDLKFKIPFKINRKINDKLSTVFYVDRKNKYSVQLKYKLSKKFLNMEYIKSIINNDNKNKEAKIYTGTIISNKVPLILNNN